MLKKQKEYEKKNTTTDTNGNLLLIRNYAFDNLQTEFFFPKLNIIEKKQKENFKRQQSGDSINMDVRKSIINQTTNANKIINSDKQAAADRNNPTSSIIVVNYDISNSNMKNQKSFLKATRIGMDQSDFKGPFVPAGSNFEYY